MWEKELQEAINAGLKAKEKIMEIYAKGFDVEIKEDNSPVTIADKTADEIIRNYLHEKFPTHAFLTEESTDSKDRLSNDFVWIVDPVDGTKDFVFETLIRVKDTLSFELSAFLSVKQFRLDVNIYLPGCSSGTATLADDGGKILKQIPFQVKNHRAKVILPFPDHFPAGKYYSIRVTADKTEYSAANVGQPAI